MTTIDTHTESRGRGSRSRSTLPRIDYGVLDSSVGYNLRRAQLAVFDDAIRTFDEVGLRPGSFSVLLVIGRNPGLRQSEVSAALGIQRTNFVALIDLLERRGLAVRKPSRQDRRSHALHLTPAGKELVATATELQRRHEASVAKRLGPDGRELLLDLLRQLNAQG